MKKIIISITLIAGAGILIWFLTFKNTVIVSPQPEITPEPTISTTEDNPSRITPTSDNPIHTETSNAQQDVPNAFRRQVQNPNLVTLYETTIVSNYALQSWGDENKGGQAVLKYDPTQGWVLLNLGGGVWDINDLVRLEVPRLIAEQLVKNSSR